MKIIKVRKQLDCHQYQFPSSLTLTNAQRHIAEEKESHYFQIHVNELYMKIKEIPLIHI